MAPNLDIWQDKKRRNRAKTAALPPGNITRLKNTVKEYSNLSAVIYKTSDNAKNKNKEKQRRHYRGKRNNTNTSSKQ